MMEALCVHAQFQAAFHVSSFGFADSIAIGASSFVIPPPRLYCFLGRGCYIPPMPRMRRSRKTATPDAKPARQSGFLRDMDTARPLASLVFLSPLLVFYVVGLIWVRPDLAAKADILVRQALEPLGLTGILAPTWLTVVILLIWHLLRRDPWKVGLGLLVRMGVETALLAVPLFIILFVFHAASHGVLAMGPARTGDDPAPVWLTIAMMSIGAGIYEELLFRLLMVGGPIFLLRHGLRIKSYGVVAAVVLVTAALFAGAHTLEDPSRFTWASFLFRTAAGAYLGFVFAHRGFGIVSGVHVLFDVVVKSAPIFG